MLLQLRMASQAADRLFEATTGTTRPRYHVLCAIEKLCRSGLRARQTSVIEATGIDRSTTSQVIKGLIDAGHVDAKRDRDDARAHNLKLTKAGREELARVRRSAGAVEERLRRATTLPEATLSSLEAIALLDSAAA